MNIIAFVRSVCGYLIMVIIGAFCFVPCFLIALLPARWRYDNRVYYWLVNFFYKGMLFSTFLPIKVKGKENIPTQPAIFVANHQSALDIPLLGSLVNGFPHVWLFLKRYSKIPVLGLIARRMNIVVDHSGLRKLVNSLYEALHLIKGQNRHVMLFPEGGRFNDGRIHNFFYGFAILAKETGRPVVPVMMKNVGKAYPPGSLIFRMYPITLIIGKPFFFGPKETEEEFLQRVHTWFMEQSSE